MAGEDDLKEYSLDPSSRQPTKKAFCGNKSSLVTAAVSTTSASSPARASMYTKKRVALASPAKFGTEKQKQKNEGGHPVASKILPSAVRKQEGVQAMEEMVRSMEEYKAAQKPKMAPLEQVVNKEEQESLAKEAARLLRLKAIGEHYAGIARAKVARDHQAKGDEEEEDTTDGESLDPGGIYSRQSNKGDGSFSYHESEASSADENEEEFGEGASGCSLLV